MYCRHGFEFIRLFLLVTNHLFLGSCLKLLCIFVNIFLHDVSVSGFTIFSNARIIDKSLSVGSDLGTQPPELAVLQSEIIKVQLRIVLQQVFSDK